MADEELLSVASWYRRSCICDSLFDRGGIRFLDIFCFRNAEDMLSKSDSVRDLVFLRAINKLFKIFDHFLNLRWSSTSSSCFSNSSHRKAQVLDHRKLIAAFLGLSPTNCRHTRWSPICRLRKSLFQKTKLGACYFAVQVISILPPSLRKLLPALYSHFLCFPSYSLEWITSWLSHSLSHSLSPELLPLPSNMPPNINREQEHRELYFKSRPPKS